QPITDSCMLTKILYIGQSNKSQLEHLFRGYVKLKYLINEQRLQLKNILKKLNNAGEIYNSVEIKSKGKKKAIRQLLSELFHEHKQISDEKIKKQLKDKLKNDKDCAEQLQYLKEKKFSFDKLWNENFYSDILSANHVKKGYYVRQIKEGLWEDSKKVYEELYNPSDPNNPNSDTFLALIIKYAFISEDELGSLDSIDVDNHYENLPDSDSESHLSNNSIEDNDSNNNYDPVFKNNNR
ncbi:552_t:CDS:2, partial [Racocetra persica]